ncbi:MAG: hypothetical protein O2U61_01265 [Candidatus Bathyarchaeota archaeon]|nr:hypothetical protein [Candidatus Bathyarchaeota archaeon]
MRICLLFILLLTSGLVSSQNLFFIGEESYPSTRSFRLSSNSDIDSRGLHGGLYSLNITIAKNENKGMLVLSTKTLTGLFIKGKTLVYLENGDVISCVDRGIYDKVNGISTTVYRLTSGEIDALKDSNIHTIRFNLKCGECESSTEEGSFSASNRSSGYGMSAKDKIDVPKLVRSLFD